LPPGVISSKHMIEQKIDNPRKNHYTWQHKINNNYIDTSLHLPDY
jgi:hypothetical protein